MTQKYLSNDNFRLSSFRFGPQLMRLFYSYNIPETAVQFFGDKKSSELFTDVTSYVLYMNLLYNVGHYKQVIEVMHKMSRDRFSIKLLPHANFVLTMAACYKLNTKESLEEALSFLKMAEESGATLSPLVLCYGAALAAEQGSGHVALELTTKAHFLSPPLRNIKITTLCHLGRTEDAVAILRGCSESDLKFRHDSTVDPNGVYKATISVVKDAVKSGSELEMEFCRVVELLRKNKLIQDKSVEDELNRVIDLASGSQAEPYDKMSDRQKQRAMLKASLQKGWKRPGGRHTNNRGSFLNFD